MRRTAKQAELIEKLEAELEELSRKDGYADDEDADRSYELDEQLTALREACLVFSDRVGEAWNGILPSGRALPGRDQVSQERARRGCDRLGPAAAVRLGPLKNKSPYGLGSEGFWIVAENLEKIDKTGLIGVER
jgi:hypothetical protein